jgi:hypothetical protein
MSGRPYIYIQFLEARILAQEGNGEPRQIILVEMIQNSTLSNSFKPSHTELPWRHPPDGMGAERWSSPPYAGAGHLSGPIRPHDQKEIFF